MPVLPAELTQAQAETCLHMLREAARAERGAQVLVDATALTRFDSSALAVLLECRRDVLHDGKRFAVRGLAPRLRELADLYGISPLLADAVPADDALAPAV
ncbi:STAS domain-containing protein [Ottowia sp.]|uniref:STAS domain-containing protein n=1 Tax=Ottowia sp. TaxID=1898956 RepID=UPI002C46B969|nr:STAS domain-containing protein [Ottowia sp.]HOB67479.1 STAS domain-containing protein [Ottowia sp.]HPZ58054.1 STAS domain-containing protein [Ottowia sp.]HQD48319.1 STAS domain-containing protein [Ottowia sp.]